MATYHNQKDELFQIANEIAGLVNEAKSLPGIPDATFADWEKTITGVKDQLRKDIIRVAVVGTIKSGKSTLVNSLLKGEYLKRGAGVVTSIVTRIRGGGALKALLFFKSWDEVNTEIEQALVLFPDLEWRNGSNRFDIRRKNDRENLQKAVGALAPEQLITNETRNANSVLLASYLNGYEQVRGILSTETVKHEFVDAQVSKHMKYVGDDSLAAFLKDVQLEIDSADIPEDVEIADCQGSDSPNPHHIAMIQDYLLLTHFIVYVVSSRTGLRQADIKFLSMIKKMGIMDNIIFVINCDFSEHDSKKDLMAIIRKIHEEISLIRPDPEIYAWSTLYNLFKANQKNLPQKDKRRYGNWLDRSGLTTFSDRETKRFEKSFYHKLTRERSLLLLRNQLERVNMVISGFEQWMIINKDLLARNEEKAKELTEKIRMNQQRIKQARLMIKNTLDGAVERIKRELKSDIDRFFDLRSIETLGRLQGFIRGYQVRLHEIEEVFKTSGFSNTLYLVFQEFKHALDTFMAEEINPEVVRFVKQEEKKIKEYFESILSPYTLIAQEAIGSYTSALNKLGLDMKQQKMTPNGLPDIDAIKTIAGLMLPPATATMQYTTRIETEAVFRLGFYSLLNVFRKILKKPVQGKTEEKLSALKDGVMRMKRETERSIVSHFKDYKENIKFQYVFKLVDAVAAKLHEILLDKFNASAMDLTDLIEQIGDDQAQKESATAALSKMACATGSMNARVEAIRARFESEA